MQSLMTIFNTGSIFLDLQPIGYLWVVCHYNVVSTSLACVKVLLPLLLCQSLFKTDNFDALQAQLLFLKALAKSLNFGFNCTVNRAW